MFKGHWSLQWDCHQQRYLELTNQTSNVGEPKWVRQMIMATWKIPQQRWKHRCDIIHDNKNPRTWEKHALLLQMKHLCSQSKLMSKNEQHTFNTPEPSWEMKTTNAIKSWIQKHKPLTQMAVRAAKQRQKINTPDIRTHSTKLLKRRKTKHETSPKQVKSKTKKPIQ